MHPENIKSCANCQENAARIGYCIFHHGNMFSFEVRILNKIKLRSHSEIIWELDDCQKEFESRSGIGADTGIWFWFDLSPTSFSKRSLIHDLQKISGIWNCMNISSAISALDIIWFRVIGFATGISVLHLSNNVNFFPNKYCHLLACFRCTLLSTTLEIA